MQNKIIKTLQNEKLSVQDKAELIWMLNAHLYKERPVTIQEFINSDDFVKKKWPNIFPIWQDVLNQLYPSAFTAPYNEVLISAAAGGGKEQDLKSSLLTPNGYIKMGDVQLGQKLLDGYGNITKVIGIFPQGKKPVYEIILEDNSRIKVGLNHINHVFKDGLPHNILTVDLLKNYQHFKIAKWNDKQEYYSIKDIKYLKDDYCQCIKVDSPHQTYISDYEIITHNTTTATIGVLYDMYKLGCLKDPCSFYNLTPGTMLIFAVFSATGSTAAVNWQDITTGIEMCPWFNEKVIDRRGLEKKNGSLVPVEILPGIFIQTGSKFQHSMGKAIFDGLMDEAAFGGDNIKEAQKTYNELSSRMATRFRSYSKTGNLPGHLFLISSPKEAGDFMQYRIDKAEQSGARYTYIKKNISSWEANPANDSEEKFTVFVGNEFKEPKIYEENEQPSLEDMDYLIYPPMSYYDNFAQDIIGSIMNYGGITTISDVGVFKSPSLVNSAMVLKNPFNMNIITLPFAKHDKQLMDFMDMDYFKDIRHPECNRFIHIDVAFSSGTLDRYGIAAGYCTLTDTTLYKDLKSGVLQASDVFSKNERMYYIDWALGIEPCKGQEIPLNKICDFVIYLIKNLNYPVACISADTFQSKQTLQTFAELNYNTESISLDRTRDPYLFLRQLVYNQQIVMPKHDELKTELLKLRDTGKKVDHIINGSKDISDAVAGCIWSCANSTNLINIGRITSAVLNPHVSVNQYNNSTPEQLQSIEMAEFEMMRQQYANGLFKGL